MAKTATPRRLRRRNIATTISVSGAAALAVAAAAGHFELSQDASASYTPPSSADEQASAADATPEEAPAESGDEEGSPAVPAEDSEDVEPPAADEIDDFALDLLPGADLGDTDLADLVGGGQPDEGGEGADDPAADEESPTDLDVPGEAVPPIDPLADDGEVDDLVTALVDDALDGSDEGEGDEGGDASSERAPEEGPTLEERIAAWFDALEAGDGSGDEAPPTDDPSGEDPDAEEPAWCDLEDPQTLFDAVVLSDGDAVAFDALLAACTADDQAGDAGDPEPEGDGGDAEAVLVETIDPVTATVGL